MFLHFFGKHKGPQSDTFYSQANHPENWDNLESLAI